MFPGYDANREVENSLCMFQVRTQVGADLLAKIKKTVLSLSVIVLFALYALQKQANPEVDASMVAAVLPETTSVTEVLPTASSGSGLNPTPSSATDVPPTAISISDFMQTAPTALGYLERSQEESAFARADATNTPTSDGASAKTNAAQTPEPAVTATETSSGAYVDGTYTGSRADAHWGTVQVLAVITNGQLTDVQFAQYPDHRSRSRTINNRAMPILAREAIQSQHFDVDVVSGATDTSEAFVKSLKVALSKATA